MKDSEILKEVSNIKTAIQNHILCEVLDKTDPKHILYQKITNATLALYINAYRLAMGKQSLLTTTKNMLTLKNIKMLMTEISDTLSRPMFAEETENQILELLRKYSLNPEELFVENTPDDIEQIRLQNILNGS